MARRKTKAEVAVDTIPAPPPVDGAVSKAASYRKKYISGGLMTGLATRNHILGRAIDDIDYWFGDETKDRMLADPAISATISFLTFSAIHNPLRAVPSEVVKLKPGVPPTAEEQAQMDKAQKYADFIQACLDRMETPIEDVILDMSEFLTHGSSLAEILLDYAKYQGETRLMLSAVMPKPRDSWQFVVNPYMEVVGIYARTEAANLNTVLPPEKAFWMTWRPKSGDPRGRSIIRPAFNAWNAKNRLNPEYLKWLGRFATPSVVGKTPEGAQASAETGYAQGRSTGLDDGSTLGSDPESALLAAIQQFQNGSAMAVPYGTEIDMLEPSSAGEQFVNGYSVFDRQIVMSILMSVRAILEAEHGSRADSESGQDVVTVLINTVRRVICRAVTWRLFHLLMQVNFGPEEAALYTPSASLGDAEAKDLPNHIRAWRQAGWLLDPMHLPLVDAHVGLPPRKYDPDSQIAGAVQPGQRAGDAGQGPQPGTRPKKKPQGS
jgi:hypothetical protein